MHKHGWIKQEEPVTFEWLLTLQDSHDSHVILAEVSATCTNFSVAST